ncbi:MAG TPA: GlsB/YeaQ/YmgE family stress response membrane protein [Anaerolineae bacterium]|nr:GlsB/YeaQ/YmgE family stress response membrane protein [Anaerolineae bacterium]HQI86093.1 GlsB/YeaQ/YmgE family stress response membrane protein [Anaerolineae bacterium]
MGLIATIIVGLIAGLLASWLMKAKTGVLTDLILGVVGSVVGGWITSLLLGVDLVSGVNLTSIIVAVIGAIVVIAVYRFLKKGR